jgi:hypothetical protein
MVLPILDVRNWHSTMPPAEANHRMAREFKGFRASASELLPLPHGNHTKAFPQETVMSKPKQPRRQPGVAKLQAELREAAQSLRAAEHLEPADQRSLADLLEELSQAINTAAAPSAEMLHVGQSAAQLAQHLHQHEEKKLLVAAKENLQRAMARAEAAAPQVVQLAGKLIDALANMGI